MIYSVKYASCTDALNPKPSTRKPISRISDPISWNLTLYPKQVAEATLVDLMLLSEADYLIGGLQSGYTRMFLALSAARQG